MDPQDQTSESSQQVPKESLFSQMFPKLKSISLGFNISSVLLPGIVILIILLVGGGGTYIIASNVFQGSSSTKSTSTNSRVSSEDIPTFETVAQPSATPTVTLAPTQVVVTPTVFNTPTPTTNPAANWISYTFSPVSLSFSYPPGWYVNVPATSGAPYMYVQNFSPAAATPSETTGVYQLQVSRLAQVGITTTDQLITQLAQNDANNTYVNGINLGYATLVSSKVITINGYAGYERTIVYSNSPFSEVKEIYVLDGVSNAIRFLPQYDKQYGEQFLQTLLSTVSFSN